MDGDTSQISGMSPAEGNDTNCLFTLHDTVSGAGWGGAMQEMGPRPCQRLESFCIKLIDPIPNP